MAKTLVVLNDAPYGTERSYDGLRYAIALLKASEEVHVFLPVGRQGGRILRGVR